MKRFGLALVLVLFTGLAAWGLGLPENVLVVQNGNSPTSLRIAAYYMAARSIPAGNLVTIFTADSSNNQSAELITPSDYQNLVEQPIRDYLSSHSLVNKIQYIVMTKGIPIQFTYDPVTGQGPAVDSMIAGIDLVNPLEIQFTDENNNVVGTTYVNRYWRSPKPFTHAEFGGYLVTRLDGYTENDAKALVDRATAVQSTPHYMLLDALDNMSDPLLQPKWYLLPDDTFDPNYQLGYADYDSDMVRCGQVIAGRPQLSVIVETTNTFVSSPNSLTCYVSWGSNDWDYDAATYHSLVFGPASLVETAVSSSGRSMLPTVGGQSMIADLISQGAAGAKGYVSEPFLDAIASPTVLFDFYTSGRNLAESYYAASRFVKWKDLVIGDPLCHLTGTQVSTVSQAKALPDGTLVSFPAKTVSAGMDDFIDRFYIEESDRSSGIQVYVGSAFPGVTRGTSVVVRGILGVRDGERVILNPSITGTSVALGAAPIRTLALPFGSRKAKFPAKALGAK